MGVDYSAGKANTPGNIALTCVIHGIIALGIVFWMYTMIVYKP